MSKGDDNSESVNNVNNSLFNKQFVANRHFALLLYIIRQKKRIMGYWQEGSNSINHTNIHVFVVGKDDKIGGVTSEEIIVYVTVFTDSTDTTL